MPRTRDTKSARIASKLRAEIVAGRLSPGATLPTWDHLETEFSAGRPTLTRAMAELKEDGFIRATRSKGTFVHERPPHLTRFGLVFPSHPSIAYSGLGRWNRFWDLLSVLATVVGEQLDLEMPVYYNLGTGLGKDEAALAEDLQRKRLGGVIVASEDAARHPVIAHSGIPRVIVGHPHEGGANHLPCVYVDRRAFVAGAMELMHEHGRRRVAVVTDRFFAFRLSQEPIIRTGTEPVPWHQVSQRFAHMMAEHGFESKPYWHLMLTPSSVRNTVRLLFNQPPAERPDGLIICDDNLTEEALAGLIEAGISVPADLHVVAHCNWPAATHPLIPTIGLGYDVRDLLRLCVRSLQAIQAGESVPQVQLLPAQQQPSFPAAPALDTAVSAFANP